MVVVVVVAAAVTSKEQLLPAPLPSTTHPHTHTTRPTPHTTPHNTGNHSLPHQHHSSIHTPYTCCVQWEQPTTSPSPKSPLTSSTAILHVFFYTPHLYGELIHFSFTSPALPSFQKWYYGWNILSRLHLWLCESKLTGPPPADCCHN